MISKSIGMLKERMEEVSFKEREKQCFARCKTIRSLLGQKKIPDALSHAIDTSEVRSGEADVHA
jgi:hypothetical protein